MEQSSFWEANTSSASQETPLFYGTQTQAPATYPYPEKLTNPQLVRKSPTFCLNWEYLN
jgi:hypothetical protein